MQIPCRTANRGSFPLNGTYFQVNEVNSNTDTLLIQILPRVTMSALNENKYILQVFADHESSLKPIDVPRAWIWNLPRRTVYFGTSIPTIFKGNNFQSTGIHDVRSGIDIKHVIYVY